MRGSATLNGNGTATGKGTADCHGLFASVRNTLILSLLRTKDEDPFEMLVESTKRPLDPSHDLRGTSTLQKSAMSMQRNVERHGDDYYLVVSAERRSADEEIRHQRFPVTMELEHESEISEYSRQKGERSAHGRGTKMLLPIEGKQGPRAPRNGRQVRIVRGACVDVPHWVPGTLPI